MTRPHRDAAWLRSGDDCGRNWIGCCGVVSETEIASHRIESSDGRPYKRLGLKGCIHG